jgi:hypothetical protein
LEKTIRRGGALASEIELAGVIRRSRGQIEGEPVCGRRPILSRGAKLLFWLAGLAGLQACRAYGQALPAGEVRANYGIFLTANGANTQLPNFADNAMGFNAGLFLQRSPLFGVEARGGAYPISATFGQAPVTAGLRFAPSQTRAIQALPFAYFGGGFSKSQYAKVNGKPSAALWAPCWQSSGGMDIVFRKFSWRVYELSWTETYTLRQNLRTLGLSTGLVYSFRR